MYIGPLETISNRETWTDSFEVVDGGNAAIDISAATAIVIAVSDPQTKLLMLSGSLADGHVTRPGGGTSGVFTWTFSATEVRKLCAKTYNVGITITLSGAVSQLFIGTIPVLDGVVP